MLLVKGLSRTDRPLSMIEMPHEVLKRHFSEKQARLHTFTLRSMARRLSLDASFLCKVLNGKRPVPLARVPDLAKALDMDEQSSHELESRVRERKLKKRA